MISVNPLEQIVTDFLIVNIFLPGQQPMYNHMIFSFI